MKTIGIIAEYNPLTYGHLYQIDTIRNQFPNATIIVCMSGNFVQRGEPAIVDKWQRARAAIDAGVDLVIELPFYFACESADYFAKGGIEILKACGCDTICFGTETLTTLDYEQLYSTTSSPHYQQSCQKYLDQGLSYPAALAKATGIDLKNPNDLLGFSYYKQIQLQKANLNLFIIHRQGDYHSLDLSSLSASSVRKHLLNNEDVSQSSPMILLPPFHTIDQLYETFYQKMILNEVTSLSHIHLVSEGIEHRLKEALLDCENLNQYLNRLSTKRYTKPRLLRTMIHILLDDYNQKRDEEHVGYLRVLGASTKGLEQLKVIKETNTLPIMSRFKEVDHPHLDLEMKATKLYSLCLPIALRKQEIEKEYKTPPYIKQDQ